MTKINSWSSWGPEITLVSWRYLRWLKTELHLRDCFREQFAACIHFRPSTLTIYHSVWLQYLSTSWSVVCNYNFNINVIFFDLNQLVKKVLSLIFVDVSIFLTPCNKTWNSLSFFVKTAFSLKHQYGNRFCLHKRVNWRTGENYKTLTETPFPGCGKARNLLRLLNTLEAMIIDRTLAPM